MTSRKMVAHVGLWVAILSAAAPAGELDSTRLRWATWPQGASVATLRWGVGIWGEPPGVPRLSIVAPAAPSVTAAPPVAVAPASTFAVAPVVAAVPAPAPPTFATTSAAAAPAAASRFTTSSPTPSPGWTLRPAAPPAVPTSASGFDAFVNMTDSGYVGAAGLTTGNELPWYLSPVAEKVYGGTPNLEQRMEFSRDVLSRVESAFRRSGLSVALTDRPGQSAAHTLSVVSGARSPASPDAVGVTEVGRDGFTFIDKLGYSQTIDELKYAVANNVAHELMHAFGVDRHAPGGSYLDSGVADWSTLIDPNATFSPEAVRELASRDFRAVGSTSLVGAQEVEHGSGCVHCLQLLASPVPEPTTWLAWGLGGLAAAWIRSRRRAA